MHAIETEKQTMNIQSPVPAGTQVTQTYQEHIDYRNKMGWSEDRYHAGIDYGGDGMSITLCDDGVFDKTGYDESGYGIYAKFKHAWGYSLYAHLKSTLPESSIGKSFEQGAVIGVSDNTGFSTGPHLHFETRNLDNIVFDPTKYIVGVVLPETLTRITVISDVGLNIRSEPTVIGNTFLGVALYGFEFDVLEQKTIDGNRWIKVPVWLAAKYNGEVYVTDA